MDAHYVTLPLGFLATATLNGFTGEGAVSERPAALRIEPAPIDRSVVHADGWSVHLNLAPQRGYDAFGIADLTLGLGRRLRFGAQAHYGRSDAHPDEHYLTHQTPFALGVALWRDAWHVEPISAMQPSGTPKVSGSAGELEARVALDEFDYAIVVRIAGDRCLITEGVGADVLHSLLVPYLYDRGDGILTDVIISDEGVDLHAGSEVVGIRVAGGLRRIVHLANSYESRHGLLGLVRLDCAAPGPVTYEVRRVS